MSAVNPIPSLRIFTRGTGLVALGMVAACSGQSVDSVEDYSLRPGWYKFEGQHRVWLFPDGKPEKTIEEFPLDGFACLTVEDVRRRSEEEVVQGMTAEEGEILEINISPFKDRIFQGVF